MLVVVFLHAKPVRTRTAFRWNVWFEFPPCSIPDTPEQSQMARITRALPLLLRSGRRSLRQYRVHRFLLSFSLVSNNLYRSNTPHSTR